MITLHYVSATSFITGFDASTTTTTTIATTAKCYAYAATTTTAATTDSMICIKSHRLDRIVGDKVRIDNIYYDFPCLLYK
jgi:hypothetical protein